MYALSGGGTTHHVARSISRPGLGTPWVMKADAIRAVGTAAGRTMGFVARGAFASLPRLTLYGAIAYGAHETIGAIHNLLGS